MEVGEPGKLRIYQFLAHKLGPLPFQHTSCHPHIQVTRRHKLPHSHSTLPDAPRNSSRLPPTEHQHQYSTTPQERLQSSFINHAMTSVPPNTKPIHYPDYCHTLSPTIGKWCPLRATDVYALKDVGMFCDGMRRARHSLPFSIGITTFYGLLTNRI
jgi:hypothetical protein